MGRHRDKEIEWRQGERMSQRNGQPYEYPKEWCPVRKQQIKTHRLVAECVVGHFLPSTVEIHHVNDDENDYRNSNLVICQDRSYHKLLHRRREALRVCGYVDWQKCTICKEYAPVEELRLYKTTKTGYQKAPVHPNCANKSLRDWYNKKRTQHGQSY